MDILILNWKDIKNPDAGGAEIIAFEFARRLAKDGHRVTFFSRRFKNCLSEERLDGVKIIRRGNKFTVYFHAYLFYRHLKKKPDRVIDMINTLCWQTPLYVPVSKRVAYVNQLAKEVLFYELPLPLSYFSYLLENLEYVPYKNTRFLCYSSSTKDDLVGFGMPKNKVNIFPIGLDHLRYQPKGEKTEYPLFLFVARLVKMKRADLCIRAMGLIIKDHPNAKLAIIGNGPEENRLRSLVQKYNLEKNVSFVNKDIFFIDIEKKDAKVKLMQRAWALLLPSVKEGWGMVVTEAAACATPAIVSNVTGLRNSVVNNKTGIILSGNPSDRELALAMQKLIEDKKLRKTLSDNAFVWSKKFDWDSSYRIFKSLLLNNLN